MQLIVIVKFQHSFPTQIPTFHHNKSSRLSFVSPFFLPFWSEQGTCWTLGEGLRPGDWLGRELLRRPPPTRRRGSKCGAPAALGSSPEIKDGRIGKAIVLVLENIMGIHWNISAIAMHPCTI